MPRASSPPEYDYSDPIASDLELHKWHVYPPDPYYIDADGNEVEWVWNAARWQWLPEGYKVVEGEWVLDA